MAENGPGTGFLGSHFFPTLVITFANEDERKIDFNMLKILTSNILLFSMLFSEKSNWHHLWGKKHIPAAVLHLWSAVFTPQLCAFIYLSFSQVLPTHLLLEVKFMAVEEPDYLSLCSAPKIVLRIAFEMLKNSL